MHSRTGYQFELYRSVSNSELFSEAILLSVINYMHHQPGWSLDACIARARDEEKRVIPKSLFDDLAKLSWSLSQKTLIDIGAGQGGTVLEALVRGAEAFGVEPSDEFRKVCRMRLLRLTHRIGFERLHFSSSDTGRRRERWRKMGRIGIRLFTPLMHASRIFKQGLQMLFRKPRRIE